MKKIFVTSLHRSATQSLHYLFEGAGIKSIHWPVLVDGVDLQSKIIGHETEQEFVTDCLKACIQKYDAISDVPIPGIFDALYHKYPNALFITVERDLEDWIASVRKHIKPSRPFDPFERTLYWKYIKSKPNFISDVSDDSMREMFTSHHDNLKKLFLNNKNYLHVNLKDKNIGYSICRFIGVSDMVLPHRDYLSEQ